MQDVLSIHTGRYVLGIFLACILASFPLYAQNPIEGDTLARPQFGQIGPEAGPGSASSEVEDAVQYQSTDSLIVDFRNGRRATLFGSAKVDHQSGSLTSNQISMDLETSTVEAMSATPEDTLTLPLLVRDDQRIRSNRILFNYETQKGKFEAARVNVGEGHLIGSQVKNVSETEVFIEDGIYSTCPPDYLYYYIKAKKMKVVDQDEIFFSNAQLFILDIPYPIIFPFGYIPTGIEQKKNGLLTPTYVFDAKSQRGIGFSNLGWFQYINDYVTTQASFDIYTSGTFYLNNITQYRKTGLFSGSMNIGYSKDQGLEPTDPSYSKEVNKSLGIQHSQTFSPYSTLSANVNLRTANYYTQNSFNIDDRAETSSNSRVAYNYKHPENLFTFSANSNLNQNFYNNTTTLSGPRTTFSLKPISPFSGNSSGSGNASWYESISFRYNNTFDSKFNYRPIDADSATISFIDALTDPSIYREATGNDDYIRFGFQQTATVGITKLIPSRFINTSASFNYNEYWYPTSIRKEWSPDSNRVDTYKEVGFTSARDFTTSISLSSTVYGISNAKIGNMEGFRHTLRPSLSFGYRPDFGDERWGYYDTVQIDSLGNTQTYSIFQNEVFTGPTRGEQRSISFGFTNVFETRIVKRDTTGEVNERTLKLIDNLSLNSSYNFAADSLNLSDLRAAMSSSAIPGLNFRANANFSFYSRNDNGSRYNEFLINTEDKLAQLERLNVTASTSFRGGKRFSTFTPVYVRRYDPFLQSVFSPIDPHFGFEPVDPLNSPWSFTLNFSYSWVYRHNEKPSRSATLNASSISFNLTPKWRFNTTIGYDFIEKELTPSQFSLNRNLECWDLSFQINPFGDNQYYFFRLTVNSSQIQSLFQKLPVLKNLERGSSNTTGKRPNSGGLPGGY